MNEVFEKARKFIYRNARPIQVMRWKYQFEKGTATDVLEMLQAYQNEDGGFGYALEADCFNPNSSPIQTWCATEILYEIGHTDEHHTVVKGILKYLDSAQDYMDGYWLAAVPSNNEYPHAPWWTYNDNVIDNWQYNPTIALAGFALLYADTSSILFQKAYEIADRAVHELLEVQERPLDGHELRCFLRFCDYMSIASSKRNLPLCQDFYIDEVKECCEDMAIQSICTDTSKWANTYVDYPSSYINGRSGVIYEGVKKLAEYECTFLMENQLEDGSYNVTWEWGAYPEEWALAKNWWKAEKTLLNMIYLKKFGCFEAKGRTGEIELRPVDGQNWYDCVCLEVDPSQKNYVASNSFSLVEAAYMPENYPFAIIIEDKIVGFLMYNYDKDLGMWGLNRLMIDRRYQKKGYGRIALLELFKLVSERLGHIPFYTSYEPDNKVAEKLYKSLGFVSTGEVIEGENYMIKQL